MQVKFFLANGGVVEWPVPDALAAAFSFPVLCSTIRANGFFQADNVYIVHDAIAAIGLDNGGTLSVQKTGRVN